jgi:hypothetical protein
MARLTQMARLTRGRRVNQDDTIRKNSRRT